MGYPYRPKLKSDEPGHEGLLGPLSPGMLEWPGEG